MKKNNGFVNLLLIVFGGILILLALGAVWGNGQISKTTVSIDEDAVDSSFAEEEESFSIPESTSNCGIYFSNLEEGDLLSDGFVIEGNTDGCGWNAFEAVIGTVKLFDSENGEQVGEVSIINATSEWMTTDPIYFEAEINYEDTDEDKDGYLVFEHQQVADEDPLLTKVIEVKY